MTLQDSRSRSRARGAALVAVGAAAALVLLAGALGPAPLAAQQTPEDLRRQAEQLLGRPLTDQEIMQMIQQSGLSPDQIRGQLESRGLEPSLADPYLEAIQGRTERPQGDTDAVSRMQIMSALGGAQAAGAAPGDTVTPSPFGPGGVLAGSDVVRRMLEERILLQRERERGPPIFGRELFLRSTTQFEPVKTGPVPDNYTIGPGDQVIVVLTGQVESSYERTVGPEGWIVLPEVGRIHVSGRTMVELNDVMFRELSRAYSGITRGDDATTDFDVTLGTLRTNQIFVIGEVERPAAYEVSALGTAMTALYRAGGPARSGSFRDIVVKRGGSEAARLDLYDYLVEGDAGGDVRLRQGDIVFVPPARNRVRLSGPVKRPGMYEFREDETLRDVIRLAGGLEPDASLRRIQVERIAADGGARPGQERRILDVSADRLAGPGEPGGFGLEAGDRITLFAVLGDVRNQVSLSGGVWRPGTYSVTEDTRLWDVLQRAGGLLPDAVQGRAQIQRLQEDNTRRMIPVSLDRDSAGEPAENPPLEGRDQVIVFAQRNLRDDRAVSIGGWVRNPGVYPYIEGMTVADLLLKAGGLRTGAYTARAEVARVTISQSRTDTLTRRYEVALDSSYVFGSASDATEAGAEALGGEAAQFDLRNLDAVYVRKSPGFEPQQRVIVTGEVRFPGPYSIQTRTERLSDVVRRAGGVTDDAYVEGFQLWRTEPVSPTDTLTATEIAGRAVGGQDQAAETDTLPTFVGGGEEADSVSARADSLQRAAGEAEGREGGDDGARRIRRTRVGIDFPRALENPDGSENILVEPGDSIHVPHYIPTVTVQGAVGRETQVLWREGEGLGYYIGQAGGYEQTADEGRVRVQFANGEVATRGDSFLFFGGGIPDPDPGSTITVPQEPPRERGGGLSVAQLIPLVTSVLGSITTIVVASN